MTFQPAPYHDQRPTSGAAERGLGLPVWALAALAMLAAPRVVLHDLGVATGGLLAALLAVGPAVVWIAVVLKSRSKRPLVALLIVGLFYGAILALVHNVFWNEAFDVAPTLGGELEGQLPAAGEQVVLRTATTISSLFTGAGVGLVCGLVAMGLQRLTRGRGDA